MPSEVCNKKLLLFCGSSSRAFDANRFAQRLPPFIRHKMRMKSVKMSANCLFSFGFFFSVFSDTVFHVTDFQCNCANGLRWMIQSPVDKMCGQIRSVMRDTWVLGQLLLYWHGGPSSSSSLTARSEQSLTNNGSRRKAEQKKVTNTSISGIYVYIVYINIYIQSVWGGADLFKD